MANDDNDQERDDEMYARGSRAAWQSMLQECLKHLAAAETDAHSWVSEREQAIAVLRRLCDDFGDNDWDENLHLADIIDKHLGDYLEKEQ